MEKPEVVLKGLSIGYKTHHHVRIVAADITANIPSGQLTCLLGQNGVGKSTLLRTLCAFQPRLGGSISIGERSIDSYSPRRLARTIGVVLTERPDVGAMTVEELVAMGRAPYTGFWGRLNGADEQLTADAIRQVGIVHLSQRQVPTLSDGERQKVMIAKALAQQTPIIFLDEPTAFLDYPSKVDVLLLLRRICRDSGKTVFLSTHDLELALQVADNIWLLDAKGKLHMGTPQELAASGVLKQFVEKGGGVSFDAQTLTVQVRGEEASPQPSPTGGDD